jgi:hypothetical protein
MIPKRYEYQIQSDSIHCNRESPASHRRHHHSSYHDYTVDNYGAEKHQQGRNRWQRHREKDVQDVEDIHVFRSPKRLITTIDQDGNVVHINSLTNTKADEPLVGRPHSPRESRVEMPKEMLGTHIVARVKDKATYKSLAHSKKDVDAYLQEINAHTDKEHMARKELDNQLTQSFQNMIVSRKRGSPVTELKNLTQVSPQIHYQLFCCIHSAVCHPCVSRIVSSSWRKALRSSFKLNRDFMSCRPLCNRDLCLKLFDMRFVHRLSCSHKQVSRYVDILCFAAGNR